MRKGLTGLAMIGVAAWIAPASADPYAFSYGFGGAVYASGVITTDNTPVSPGAANVVNITGSRFGVPITGFDDFPDFGDQLVYPKSTSAVVDQIGITYQVGAYSYNIYSIGSGLYTEFRYLTADSSLPGVGTTVSNFTLTPATVAGAAPEPATWATMILGLGIAGFAIRRRRTMRVSLAAG